MTRFIHYLHIFFNFSKSHRLQCYSTISKYGEFYTVQLAQWTCFTDDLTLQIKEQECCYHFLFYFLVKRKVKFLEN